MTVKKKKPTKNFAHVYHSPEGDLVYVGKEVHGRIQSTQSWYRQNLKLGEFEYQARNMFDTIIEFRYIKKIEFRDIKNFIMSFQAYVGERHPLPKKQLCRFTIEFKSSLKYDMIADLFINGRPLYYDIMKEQDLELRDLKLQYFYEPFGYPLFKLPNSNSKDLWSGFISKDAIKILKTRVKPEIEREHAIARSVIIPKLFTDYYEFIEAKKGSFLKTLFESKDGFGQFHLVTKAENMRLKEFQDDDTIGNPLLAYQKAGIELVNVGDGTGILFSIPKVNWWVSGEARAKANENGIDEMENIPATIREVWQAPILKEIKISDNQRINEDREQIINQLNQ